MPTKLLSINAPMQRSTVGVVQMTLRNSETGMCAV
jgi:hypothetical protein